MDPVQEPESVNSAEHQQHLANYEAALRDTLGKDEISTAISPAHSIEKSPQWGEERYRSLFENMTEGCALHEIICDEQGKPCDYRFIEINPAFERLTGLRRDQIPGKLASEVLPGLEPFWIDIYGQVALTRRPVQFDHFTQVLNRYYRVYAYSPAPNYFAAIFMDITDQKQVELQLNEVAEKYFTLFNSTSDGVWIHNLQGEILEVNDAYCQMSGYSRDELIGMHISLLEANESPTEIATHIQKLLDQEGHDRFESRHLRKDGTIFDVDITALYYDLEDGRIAIFARDITTRKQVERRLAYLASFPEFNPNPITEVDFWGNVHYANPTARTLFPDLMDKRIAHDWFADWEMVILPFRQGSREMIVRDVTVGERSYQQSLSLIADEELVRIYGTDITARKQAEQAIHVSEERYRSIVETATEGIVLARPDGHFTYVNQRMADMLGYPIEDILGKTSLDFMFDIDRDMVMQGRSALNRGETYNGEFNFRRKDGSVLWSMYNAVPIFNAQGEHIANLAMHTDITARKQAEDAIQRNERRLNRAEEIAHLGSWELDVVNDRLTWSDEVYRLFGFEPHEFPATYEAFLEAVHPEDRAAVDAAYTSSLREGRDSYEIEHRLVKHATGEVRIVHEKCVHFRDASGQVIRSEGMVHDITERKLQDLALRKAHDELELRVQERTQALKVINEQLTKEAQQREKAQEELESSLHELQVIEEELRNYNERLVDAQKILDAERRRYQDLFDFAPYSYLVTDTNGMIQAANENTLAMLRLPREDLLDKSILSFVDQADHVEVRSLIANLEHHQGVQAKEIKLHPRSGPMVITSVLVVPVKDQNATESLRWGLRDITARKQAEETIRLNSMRNAVLSEVSGALAEASLDEKAILDIVVKAMARLVGDGCVIALISPDGQYLDPVAWSHKNPKAAELMDALYTANRNKADEGIAGQVFQTAHTILLQSMTTPQDRLQVSPAFRRYGDEVGVTSLLIVPLKLGNRTIGTLGISRDAGGKPYTLDDQALLENLANRTAQSIHNARLYQELQVALKKELEMHDQLVQSEKFAAIGRLLASITHEINNPLQTIKNCLYLSQQDTVAGTPVAEYLRMASTETDRLSNLVAQLREVYRPPTRQQVKPVNLPIMLSEVRTLLTGYLQEKHVTWKVNPYETLFDELLVEVVPEQMKQVFLNISLNAIDAMEPLGGSITIQLKMPADQGFAGVCFQDNGPGIAPEVKDQLFEPFNTTKEKGLGLGLTICYDIIQKHNGSIEVESQPGEGAAFTVWLPVKMS